MKNNCPQERWSFESCALYIQWSQHYSLQSESESTHIAIFWLKLLLLIDPWNGFSILNNPLSTSTCSKSAKTIWGPCYTWNVGVLNISEFTMLATWLVSSSKLASLFSSLVHSNVKGYPYHVVEFISFLNKVRCRHWSRGMGKWRPQHYIFILVLYQVFPLHNISNPHCVLY